VIILVQIVLSILAVYESFNNIIPLAVIFIVISAGFLAFYIVTAIRISKRIKKALAMTAPDEDKMQNLKTVSTMHHLILKYCLIIII
jgi:flagellar motor component MotA